MLLLSSMRSVFLYFFNVWIDSQLIAIVEVVYSVCAFSYLHSNCLYNHKMEGRNHSSDSLASNSSNSKLGRDSASSSRGLHF
jgi:hypothetical protein